MPAEIDVVAVMHVEETGDPHGVPMLLVHGFLSSACQWDLNRDALGERCRLFLAELPGHGRSPAPSDGSGYEPGALAAEFERIRVDRGVDTWWVCGQSLGGGVAVQYLLAHQDRVRGFVFTNSRATFGIERPGVSQPASAVSQPASAVSQPASADPIDPAALPPLGSVRDLPIHPMNAKRLPEPVKTRMIAAADAMPLHAVREFMARRRSWDATDRLGEIRVPVLLVNGRWEKAFQPFADLAMERIANLERVDLQGGHAVNAECAAEFNAAVLDFVDRHERSAPTGASAPTDHQSRSPHVEPAG